VSGIPHSRRSRRRISTNECWFWDSKVVVSLVFLLFLERKETREKNVGANIATGSTFRYQNVIQGCFLSDWIGGLNAGRPLWSDTHSYIYDGGTLLKDLHNSWVVGCVIMEVLEGNWWLYA
jgi:hypothetical protein